MTETRRRRLENIEAAVETSDQRLIKVEFYNVSPDGDLIRIPNAYDVPDDDRPAKNTIQVVFADGGENGGLGQRILALGRRRLDKEERDARIGLH
jgi:hypothetical protein